MKKPINITKIKKMNWKLFRKTPKQKLQYRLIIYERCQIVSDEYYSPIVIYFRFLKIIILFIINYYYVYFIRKRYSKQQFFFRFRPVSWRE